MEQFFSILIKVASSKNVLYLFPLIILYILWSWNSRNRFERVFLPKNIAIFYKLLVEIVWLIGIIVFTLLWSFNIDSLLNASIYSWSSLLLVTYVGLVLFHVLYDTNYKQLKNNPLINLKKTKIFLSIFTIVLSWLVFLYLIQLMISSIENTLTDEFTETGEIIKFLFFKNDSFVPLIVLAIFSVLFYLPLRNLGGTIVREFMTSFNLKKPLKVTVVLKNGKEIKEVFMNNNHPGKYLHMVNKESSSTQHIAINKEEIEYILIVDDNHQSESDIKIIRR